MALHVRFAGDRQKKPPRKDAAEITTGDTRSISLRIIFCADCV